MLVKARNMSLSRAETKCPPTSVSKSCEVENPGLLKSTHTGDHWPWRLDGHLLNSDRVSDWDVHCSVISRCWSSMSVWCWSCWSVVWRLMVLLAQIGCYGWLKYITYDQGRTTTQQHKRTTKHTFVVEVKRTLKRRHQRNNQNLNSSLGFSRAITCMIPWRLVSKDIWSKHL